MRMMTWHEDKIKGYVKTRNLPQRQISKIMILLPLLS
uniref:Uncharacterized protein n=1 Tax=Anguilla anguilla TaxID=7936 RepID=A0A0E9VCZ4_ANGAN